MRWPFSGRRARERSERERELAQAEYDVARIRERADKVAEPLRRRLSRNHWGDTARAIARREI